MKKIFFLFSFILIFSTVLSQGWEKKYKIGPGAGYDGYIMNTIESKSGDYIVVGHLPESWIGTYNRVFLMKIDLVGDTLWTKTYAIPVVATGSGLSDYFYNGGITELTDSSILVIGIRNYDSLSITYVEELRIHVDKNGNQLSYSRLPAIEYSCYFLMENSNAGGYYTGGRDTIPTSLYDAYPSIKKYDDSGTLLWQHVNTNSTTYGGSIQSMTVTGDSGIVVHYCYASYSPTDYMHIYKLDKNGNLLWDKNCANTIRHIYSTGSNSTVICYTWGYASLGNNNNYITEFDSNGDSISGFQLGFEPLKIAENQYGGYTVMGYLEVPLSSIASRSYLVAYDSLWNTVWQQFDDNNYKIMSGSGFGSGLNWNPLLRTPDNGYLFGGYYNDFMGPGYHPWVFRTDSLGNTYNNSISGRVSEDDNSDCIFNSSDHGYNNILVSADDGTNVFYTFSHYNGTYAMRADSGNYTVTHYLKPYRIPVCPATGYSISLAPYDTASNLNFYDYLTMNFTDVAVYATAWIPPVPGNNYSVDLSYANYGTDTASGTISFTYDSMLAFVSSSMIPTTTVGNTLTFNYSGFIEDSSATINLNFSVDTTAILGDTLLCSAAITTVNTDIDLISNSDQFMAIVVSSYDPNDKSVSPEGVGSPGYIVGNETLEYLVRFQNTGTYQAQNIVIRDTISDNLDMSTFQLLSSSFPCTVSIVDQRTVYFKFQNINLPDSTNNEPESHGYVKYSIKPVAALSPGTPIRNTAYIYFDFNSPVITNTALNTIAFPIGIEEVGSTNGSVVVYPNPFTDNTTFVIQSGKLNELYSFELTDVLGKTVKSKTRISEKQFEISRDGLENGIYFYKIYTSESVIGIGKVVIK